MNYCIIFEVSNNQNHNIMRTVNKEYKVFKFDELSKEVQDKVLSDNNDVNVEYDGWWDLVYEAQREKLKEHGFTSVDDIDFSFSGFYSQGDGASFTYDGYFDFDKFNAKHNVITNARLKKLIFDGHIDIKGVIKRDKFHMYVHEKTTSFYIDIDYYGNRSEYPNIEDVINSNELEEKIQAVIVDLNKEIYTALQSTYDDLTSNEAVKGTIDANEWEFLEDGTIFNED